MAKDWLRVYLDVEDIKRLKDKSEQIGFSGRGKLSRFLEKVAREPLFFLDKNLSEFLKVLNLKPQKK